MQGKALKITIVLAAVVAVVGLADPSASAAPKDTSKMMFFEDGSPAGGVSKLVRDGEAGAVSAEIHATHLSPGHAHTFWFVVFNDPSLCSAPACGEDDIFVNGDPTQGPNAEQINAVGIAVLGGNGEVANNGGRATFSATLFEDSALGHDVVFGPGGVFDFPHLLQDAMTAEIHIVLRDHGPAQSGADLAEQLMTFGGNCTNVPIDDDPTFMCFDPQFAVHN